MKNIILGVLGGLILVCSAALCLSFYRTTEQKNEMENHLSAIVEGILQEYFVPEEWRTEDTSYPTNEQVRQEIEQKLSAFSGDATIFVQIKVCDLEKGIIAVSVEETYQSLTGEKSICYERTALVAYE